MSSTTNLARLKKTGTDNQAKAPSLTLQKPALLLCLDFAALVMNLSLLWQVPRILGFRLLQLVFCPRPKSIQIVETLSEQ